MDLLIQIILVLVAASTAVTALHVSTEARDITSRAMFGLFAVSIAAWAATVAGFLSSSNPVNLEQWATGFYISASLFGYGLLMFSMAFENKASCRGSNPSPSTMYITTTGRR